MSTPTVTDIVREMRTTLGTPAAWTKGSAARNVAGDPCVPSAPEAVSWCLTGATLRQKPPEAVAEAVIEVLLAVAREDLDRPELFNLEALNDGRFTTHDDIVDFLNRGYARSSARA